MLPISVRPERLWYDVVTNPSGVLPFCPHRTELILINRALETTQYIQYLQYTCIDLRFQLHSLHTYFDRIWFYRYFLGLSPRNVLFTQSSRLLGLMIARLSLLQKKSTKLDLSSKKEVSRMSWKRIGAISRAATTVL